MEPGMGKTVIAMEMALELQGPIMVVAPLSLHDSFRRSLCKFHVLESDQHRFTFCTPASFRLGFIKNRELVKDSIVIVDEAHCVRTNIRAGLVKKLKAHGYPMMELEDVLLHVEKYPNLVSESLALIEACRLAKKVMFLSGTPLVNDVFDIANFLSLAQNRPIEDAKSFRHKVWDMVHEWKKYFIFYHEKKKDSSDFPKINITQVVLAVDKEQCATVTQRKQLNEHYKALPFHVGDRMCGNAIPFKSNYIGNMILSLPPEYKILIHSTFKENGVHIVGEMLRKIQRKFVTISGDEDEMERSQNFLTFCDPKSNVNVCLISPAGCQGLDFCGVRAIFVMESQWNKATMNQIIGRGARRGSHNHLPEDQRNLKVYQMMMTYPDDVEESADQRIQQHSDKKFVICQKLLNALSSYYHCLFSCSIKKRKFRYVIIFYREFR
jgi:hypothetical protein